MVPVALPEEERAITRTHSPGIERAGSTGSPSDSRSSPTGGTWPEAPAATSLPQPPSDAELATRSATDPEAFGLLYDRYCDKIHRFVYARLRDRPTAEDVTAEVFFKALRAIGSYNPASGPFSPWLYRIASNAVIDHVRARRPTVSLEPEMDSTDPARPVEQQAIDRVEVARVWRAVEELSEAQRTAVVLRLEGDLPIAEIAGRMNRSEGAVKLLLHRGLNALRDRLRDSDLAVGHR